MNIKAIKYLLDPTATGGSPAEKVTEETPPQTKAPEYGNPPPAAEVVINGKRTEREIELEEKLDKARKLIIDREKRVNELEDENHRIKTVTQPGTKPQPSKKDAWTFWG